MPPATDEFRPYLALEEPLTSVYTGRLSDDAGWIPVTVALTDRRLICLADDGTFVSVDFDAVSSVRGRPRSTLHYRGNDTRHRLAVGIVVAAIGVVVAAAVTGGLLAPALAVVGLASFAAATHVRRHGAGGGLVDGDFADIDLGPVDGVDDELESVRESARRLGDRVSESAPLRRIQERMPDSNDALPEHEYADRVRDGVARVRDGATDIAAETDARVRDVAAGTDRDRALLAAGTAIGVAGFGGALLVASGLLVLPGLALLVAGAGLVDYARRTGSPDERVEVTREREHEVRVSTDGGRAVHLRSEPSTDLARDLGRLASVGGAEEPPVVSHRS